MSSSLIKARGSEDARHEEFVDQLQQVTGYRAPLASPRARSGDGGEASAAVLGTQGATQPLGQCQPLSGAAAVPGTGKSRPSPFRRISYIIVEGHHTRSQANTHALHT